MATENRNQNILVNLFHKGMNTDTAINMLDQEHYIYGQNIRITQTTPLGAVIDVNRTKGCVTPVPKGIKYEGELQDLPQLANGELPYTIMATASIDDIGAVIIKDNNNKHWYVYRVEKNSGGGLLYTFIFTADDAITDKKTFSVVMSQELQDVIKLYIATDQGIAQFNISSNDDEYNQSLTSVDQAISNRLWPYNKPIIEKKTAGTLPVGQVQWVYRLYKNHGVFSKLSATTNKIQVFSANRAEAKGNEQASIDDEGKLSTSSTGIGFMLKFNLGDFSNIYDHVQLFRIQYYTQDLIKVFLVSQTQVSKDQDYVRILDDGIEPLQEYTLEEFSALEGLDIVADSIDTASQYMFAGNIEDRSSLKAFNDSKALASHTCSVSTDGKVHLMDDNYDTQNELKKSFSELSAFDTRFYNKGHRVNDIFESELGNDSCPSKYHPDEVDNNIIGGKSIGQNDVTVSWKLVYASIKLHDDARHGNPTPKVTDNASYDICYLSDDPSKRNIPATQLSSYLTQHGILCLPELYHYGDQITSSMFRSLRRGETYRYGIIYYNKYGQRSDVQWIDDIKVPSNCTFEATSFTEDRTKGINDWNQTSTAHPIGIEFSVSSTNSDIVRYQIVRCAHTKEFSKQLYQVVQNAPIRTSYSKDQQFPWSPHAFLQDFKQSYYSGYKENQLTCTSGIYDNEHPYDSVYLKVLQGPDINYQRQTTLQRLKSSNILFRPVRRLYSVYKTSEASVPEPNGHPWLQLHYNRHDYQNWCQWNNSRHDYSVKVPNEDHNTPWIGGAVGMCWPDSEKNARYVALHYYASDELSYDYTKNSHPILQFEDVKNPNWEDNFVDVETGGQDGHLKGQPHSAAEQYKGFTSTLFGQTYDNWMCYSMYNMRPGLDGSTDDYMLEYEREEEKEQWMRCPAYLIKGFQWEWKSRMIGHAWSGPGPVALLAAFAKEGDEPYWGPWGGPDENSGDNPLSCDASQYGGTDHFVFDRPFITTTIALEQNGSTYQGTSRNELQYDTYYGFGNYGEVNHGETNGANLIVFDGDTYITPAEIQTAYKTWNKISSCTYGILSTSVINYVPLESEINSTLDYGENFKNTQNQNVQLEPCDIEGVGSQARPQFQYNMVMSYNNYSAMSFTAQTLEDVDENYPQRIFFSEQKENGEAIDNWGLFKTVNYVDANTRYGQITNLLTSKETLYFWQPSAFGKLSVNERSLITDENSNKIQLGTGGVLQRTDYLDTDSGMKYDERAAINVGDSIYWIDSIRRSVMKYQGNDVLSCGVHTATQNLLNWKFDQSNIPYISYDTQNDEVLCKCLTDGNQVVYVHNLNLATSEYTREYQATISLHSILYGLNMHDNTMQDTQYNFLTHQNIDGENGCGMMDNMILKFVLNTNPETVKVFDDQKIVIVNDDISNDRMNDQLLAMTVTYLTDIHGPQSATGIRMSYREGEFKYAIPRWGEQNYGNRFRGKWMSQEMSIPQPTSDMAISQILTKVRTSYS